MWMRKLTAELGNAPTEATTIFEDSQLYLWQGIPSSMAVPNILLLSIYHFIREKVRDGIVKLNYCPTEEMIADILTKGLLNEQFAKLPNMAGIVAITFRQQVRRSDENIHF